MNGNLCDAQIVNVSGDYVADSATKYDFGKDNTFDTVKIEQMNGGANNGGKL